MSLQKNKAVVRRLFDEVWNKRDIDVLDEIIAPHMIHHRNDGTRILSTPQDQTEIFVERFAGFAELRVVYEDSVGEGDKVAVSWIATAVNKKTREKMQKAYINIFRIQDGKIAEVWTCY